MLGTGRTDTRATSTPGFSSSASAIRRAPGSSARSGPEEGNPGETSRELRIWPAQHLLLVLNFGCDPFIHDCAGGFVRPTIRFYDISDAFADRPRLVSTYKPSETPHEFFLWQDPSHAGRALLYMSTPGAPDTVLITDISRAREGKFEEVASWGEPTFPTQDRTTTSTPFRSHTTGASRTSPT